MYFFLCDLSHVLSVSSYGVSFLINTIQEIYLSFILQIFSSAQLLGIPFSKGSSQPRDWTPRCRQILNHSELQGSPQLLGKVKVAMWCLTLMWPHRLEGTWNSPGQNTGVGSLSLLQRIFPNQGSSSESSRPRNRMGVSYIAGGFFNSWAPREAL